MGVIQGGVKQLLIGFRNISADDDFVQLLVPLPLGLFLYSAVISGGNLILQPLPGLIHAFKGDPHFHIDLFAGRGIKGHIRPQALSRLDTFTGPRLFTPAFAPAGS